MIQYVCVCAYIFYRIYLRFDVNIIKFSIEKIQENCSNFVCFLCVLIQLNLVTSIALSALCHCDVLSDQP